VVAFFAAYWVMVVVMLLVARPPYDQISLAAGVVVNGRDADAVAASS